MNEPTFDRLATLQLLVDRTDRYLVNAQESLDQLDDMLTELQKTISLMRPIFNMEKLDD